MDYQFTTDGAGKDCLDVLMRVHDGSATIGNWTAGVASQTLFVISNAVAGGETLLQSFKDANSTNGWNGVDKCWVEIGMIQAENKIGLQGGETVPTGKCTNFAISKEAFTEFVDQAINVAKVNTLTPLIGTVVDILFVKKSLVGEATADNAWGLASVPLNFDTSIVGGGQSLMTFNMTKEIGIGDVKDLIYFKGISVQSA